MGSCGKKGETERKIKQMREEEMEDNFKTGNMRIGMPKIYM